METRRAGARVLGAILLVSALLGAAPGEAGVLPPFAHVEALTQGVEAPTAVAVDGAGRLYVAESMRGRVRVLGPDGALLRSVGGMGEPVSVAVDGDGRVYVGDAAAGEVRVYNDAFQGLGSLGRGAGEFRHPSGIAPGEGGDVYVADLKAHGVKVFGADLARKATLGSLGSGNGQFRMPLSLAWDRDAGELYVVDLPLTGTEAGSSAGVRVQVLDRQGNYLRSFGSFGRGDGFLISPAGVALDGAGRVYVADSFQNVVQVFDAQGAFLGSIFDLQRPMRTPLGLTYSRSAGRLFVGSLNLKKVDVYQVGTETHTVSIEVAGSGSVAPAGPVAVAHGDGATFAATPAAGWHVASASVAGQPLPVDQAGQFAVSGVTADLSVRVVFEQDAAVTEWTLNAAAGEHGAVAPAGLVRVADGASQTFHVMPAAGYHLSEVRLDRAPVPLMGATEYTVAAVHANHTLRFAFAPDTAPGADPEPVKTWTVTATAGAGGAIQPSGAIAVNQGTSVRFTLAPAAGYRVADLLVDGASRGPVSSYLLRGVASDHTLAATFAPKPAKHGNGSDATGRYVDNGDGTITDAASGLMWLADLNCAAAAGYDPGALGAGILTWRQSLEFVRQVDDGLHPLCAAGRSDWRLPNARELETLAHSMPGRDRCGEGACPSNGAWLQTLGFTNLPDDPAWASTSAVDQPVKAWSATLADGRIHPTLKTSAGAALLVRSLPGEGSLPRTGQTQCYDESGEACACQGTGQDGDTEAGAPWPSPRFTDHGDGTVADAVSGLVWLKDAGCLGQGEGEAPATLVARFNAAPGDFQCLDYAGSAGDWRLPTREELRGLLDYAQVSPGLPPSAPFHRVGPAAYWVSGDAGAQTEDLGRAARVGADAAVAASAVWPVRQETAAPADDGGGGGGGGGCFVGAARGDARAALLLLLVLAGMGGARLRPRSACRFGNGQPARGVKRGGHHG